MRSAACMLACLVTLSFMSAQMPLPPYPETRTEKLIEKLHGIDVADPYRWLEDGDQLEVKAWTEKQNAYTQAYLERLPGRDALRKRFDQLLSIGRISAAQPARGKYFYTKRTGTQNQPILYVREGVEGKDRVLLDPNALAADGTTALDWWHTSDDGRYIAYGLSTGGSEKSTLRIRDVATGQDLPEVIPHTRACSVAWTPDSKGFYYTRYPAPGSVAAGEENYFRRVYYHGLGGDPDRDLLVFGEGRDKEDWPNVSLSPDGRWLVVTVEKGWSKSEVYLRDLESTGPFVPVVERVDALYDVIPRNDALLIRTNEGAPRYRVFKADPRNPARETWKEIIREGTDVLDNLAAVGNRLAGLYMHKATSRLALFDRDGKPVQEVELPVLGTIAGMGGEHDGREMFFGFESFTVAPSVYRVDLGTGQAALWEKLDAPAGLDSFEVKQVTYPSKDGTAVTMFLAHKKGLKLDGNNPTYLTGYGGFNISRTPAFAASLFPFLEDGGVFAMPNLRGGGEYGESWHQAGMLDKKQNVFDDFLAAAEWLIAYRYTNPRRLCIQGGSNGGLLIGAAVTQRPDLFRVAVCSVPLLDMLRYHKFRIARLWIPEYGDPDLPDHFQWLNSYSPYHRVKDGVRYPAMLFTAAESDTRVDPLHARKMAARLQAASGSGLPVLLRLETKAGHGAGKPRSKVLDEMVDVWCFIRSQLGMT